MNDAVTPLRGKRCLILEDEFVICLDLERILEIAGAQDIVSTSRVDAAREALARGGLFDFALLDMNIQGASSLPFANEIKAAGVPFVFITGMSRHTAVPAELAGTPILEKPFEEQALLTLIAQAMTPA